MGKTSVTVSEDKKSLIIERRFDAARNKVWAAFTQKDIFVRWYAPDGWSASVEKFDFSVGGETLFSMTCEDKEQGEWYGQTERGKFVYTSIDAENTYGFRNHFVDEQGADQEGMPVSNTAMVFTDEDGGTLVVATDVYDSAEELQMILEMGAAEGIEQTWDKLGQMLKS